MRRTVVLLSSLAVLASSLLVPTAVADPRRAPAECAAALDCTAADIDLMSMPERLEFVRAMQAGPQRGHGRRRVVVAHGGQDARRPPAAR